VPLPYLTAKCDDYCMEIKEHRLVLFIELYKEIYGNTLSPGEAYKKASLLLNYAPLCIKPLAKADENGINNMRNENDD